MSWGNPVFETEKQMPPSDAYCNSRETERRYKYVSTATDEKYGATGTAVYESAYDDGRKTVIAGPATNASRDGDFSLSEQIAGAGLRNAGTGGGGGLKGMLSRFLPGSGGGSAAASAPAAASGGAGAGLQGIQNLASPASLSSMLGNVQKVLGVARRGYADDSAVRSFSTESARHDEALQPIKRRVMTRMNLTRRKKQTNRTKKDEAEKTDETDETEDENKSDASSKTSKKTSEKASASKEKDAAQADSAEQPRPKRTSGRSKPKLYI